MFAGIVERHGAIELTENRRQHDPDERRALAAIRDGVGRDYLAFAEGQGRLISRGDASRHEDAAARGLVGRRPGRPPGQRDDRAPPPRRRRVQRPRRER